MVREMERAVTTSKNAFFYDTISVKMGMYMMGSGKRESKQGLG
jgi:hypothetical protein